MMRKLLAVCLVVMMVVSFGTISAMAFATSQSADLALSDAEVSVGTETVTVQITLTPTTNPLEVVGFEGQIVVPEGLELTAVGNMPGTVNKYDSTQSDFSRGLFTIVDPDVGFGDSGIPTVSEATVIDLTFKIKDPSVAKTYSIDWNTSTNAYTYTEDYDLSYVDFKFTKGGSVTVKAAAPAVKTVAKTDSKIVPSATTIGDKTTDTQIGAAVGIQFTAPAGVTLQNKMIWAVETSAGRKYSKAVDVDFSGITGTVTVAATFHNGIHENSFGVAPVAPLGITGVDAIFTDGTNDYYTNAADKEAKAE